MDIERDVISKAIQSKTPERVISAGFEIDHFVDKECIAVWDWTIKHLKKYKASPSLKATKNQFPEFQFSVSSDPLDYLLDQFRDKVKFREAVKLGRTFMKSIENPEQVKEIELVALDMARKLTEVVPSPEVGRYSDMNERIETYHEMKEKGVQLGIMTGIKSFDDVTMGIQPHDLVVIAAFLGVGKSTLMQWMLFQAYLQGKTPMLISLEMEHEALFRKWDAMALKFQYRALKALELGEGDIEKWKRMAEKAAEASAEKDIIVIDDLFGCTVDKVYAETIRYEPDIVGIDYINLMKSRGGGQHWEKIQDISQGLKQNARTAKIPILAAAQGTRETARGGMSLEAVASSISISRDCDVFIGLHQDEDDLIDKRMQVGLFKNRDGPKAEAIMRWELDTMNIHELTPDRLMGRKGAGRKDEE